MLPVGYPVKSRMHIVLDFEEGVEKGVHQELQRLHPGQAPKPDRLPQSIPLQERDGTLTWVIWGQCITRFTKVWAEFGETNHGGCRELGLKG